jgi:WD40 repeat protein
LLLLSFGFIGNKHAKNYVFATEASCKEFSSALALWHLDIPEAEGERSSYYKLKTYEGDDSILAASFHPKTKEIVLIEKHKMTLAGTWKTLGKSVKILYKDRFSVLTKPVEFNAAGTMFAYMVGHNVGIWDWKTKKVVEALPVSCRSSRTCFDCLHCLQFSPDNKKIAIGTDYGVVQVWDTSTWTKLLEYKVPEEKYNPVSSLSFSSDSKKLAFTLSSKTCAKTVIWDLEKNKKQNIKPVTKNDRPYFVKFFQNDQTLILMEVDTSEIKDEKIVCKIVLYNTDIKKREKLCVYNKEVLAIALSPDEQILLVESIPVPPRRPHTIDVWNLKNKKMIAEIHKDKEGDTAGSILEFQPE